MLAPSIFTEWIGSGGLNTSCAEDMSTSSSKLMATVRVPTAATLLNAGGTRSSERRFLTHVAVDAQDQPSGQSPSSAQVIAVCAPKSRFGTHATKQRQTHARITARPRQSHTA